jgi:hypothetical protein
MVCARRVSGKVDPVTDREHDGAAAQLAEVRERLLRDARVAGTPESEVSSAVDEAAAAFANARVTSFVAVLVEREVRARLGLRPQTHPA